MTISASSTAMMSKGMGIEISLVNLDSQRLYKSTALGGLSKYSVVQNLPPGRYAVVEVRLPLGGLIFKNWSDDLAGYFGEVMLAPGQLYYFGDYRGRQRIGFRDVMTLVKIDSLPPPELLEKFEVAETGWRGVDFIPVGASVGDTLMVY